MTVMVVLFALSFDGMSQKFSISYCNLKNLVLSSLAVMKIYLSLLKRIKALKETRP